MTDSAVAEQERTHVDRRADLEQAVQRLVEVGAAGAQFLVADGEDVLRLQAGSVLLGGSEPIPEDARFRVACITKMFIATVVLQLAGEGRIRLEDPAEQHLAGRFQDPRVTVRHLLQHTSGLFNHADSFQRPGERFLRDRYNHYGAADLLAIATARPLNFDPGSQFEYSNTNYIALGLIIERVTGRHYAVEVRERILEPLGLRNTSLPGDDPVIHGSHARGYMKIQGESVDVTEMNPSEACSAGEIISTLEDLDTFLVALVSGRLLAAEQLAQMMTTIPSEWVPLPMSAGYGLGFMPLETNCGLSLWGHGGGIPGYATFVGATLDGRKRVLTSMTLDIDPDDFAGTFENAVVTALEAAAVYVAGDDAQVEAPTGS